MAWGLLIVAVDLRFDDLDVVPDPLGWLFALAALTSLAGRHRAFGLASSAAFVGLVVSVPLWFGGQDALELVHLVAELVVVFSVCTAVMAVCPAHRASADRLRWWTLGVTAAGAITVVLAREDDALAPLALVVVLAGLVVFVLVVLLLFRAAREPAPGRDLSGV